MITKKNKIRKFKSLAVTLAITFSGLIIIVLLIVSSLLMYFSFQAQQKVLFAQRQLIAQNAANTVENFIREKYRILESVASRSKLAIMNQKEQKPVLEKLLGLEPIFRQLVLLNINDEELVRVSRVSNILAEKSMEYSKNELVYQVHRNEKYLSSIYIDKVTSEPMVIMAVPVTDIFGDYKGTLVAESNLKFMWDLMDQIKIGKNGHAYVVDMQGYLIAFRDISRVLKRENLIYLKEVYAFVKNSESDHERGTEISKGILNNYVLATHVHLNTPKWAVIVELPVMEAYETVIMTLILSGLVMLLSIIMAVISGVFLSRRVTKPIIELRDAAKKIGKGQLSLKIDIKADNEIGDLATGFNKMVEDLNNTTVSRDALVKEVTERKQVEKTLKESEQKMKAILMASPIGIGLLNNGKLIWANETLYRMVGYEEVSLLGKSTAILYLNDKEYERVRKELNFDLTGTKTGHVETRWVCKDGTVFDCILGSCPLDPTDLSKGQIVTVNDISESKRLQSKLLHAQKMEAIGTLAAGVAHDLNNILVSLVSYPELLLMKMSKNNALRKPLLTIQKSGERAATIVQDLLTMARRGVTISEIINLNDIISEYLKSPEYENLKLFHPDVKVKTNLDKNLLNILGSSVHLSKSIMNLVSNAAESMSNGGKIFITTQNRYIDKSIAGYENIDEGDYVTLTVADRGEGISKEDMKKIFEPFYTKKKMGRSGTGLGMAVVWGTVKDHNGYIDLQSIKGKGTTFTLYFPVSRQEIVEEKAKFTIKDYMAKGERILVIDDVEEQRIIVSQILKKLGYKVTAVSSGEEAVDYMKNNSADLLILDMIMDPGIDGLETYKRILTFHPNQKALITSGFSETEHVKEAQRLGAGEYIRKPYSFEKIGMAVKNELDK
jgi:two-component system cell cycle sensor histidine kinase/response regulator CckA